VPGRSRGPVAWEAVTDTAPTRLTRETHERLRAELEDLTTRGRVEMGKAPPKAGVARAAPALPSRVTNSAGNSSKNRDGIELVQLP